MPMTKRATTLAQVVIQPCRASRSRAAGASSRPRGPRSFAPRAAASQHAEERAAVTRLEGAHALRLRREGCCYWQEASRRKTLCALAPARRRRSTRKTVRAPPWGRQGDEKSFAGDHDLSQSDANFSDGGVRGPTVEASGYQMMCRNGDQDSGGHSLCGRLSVRRNPNGPRRPTARRHRNQR